MHRPLATFFVRSRSLVAVSAAIAVASFALHPATASAQAVEVQQLTSPVPISNEYFGDRIAIDGDLMVIGGRGEGGTASSAGKTWVFRFDPATQEWLLDATLTSSTPETNGAFGYAVAIHGEVIAVSARYEDSATAVDCGAVHLFRGSRPSTGSWIHEARLTSTVALTNMQFGRALAVHDDVLLVGAPYENTTLGINSGQVHVFEYDRPNRSWNETTTLLDPDGSGYDYAGSSLAFDGTTALVGTPGEVGSLGFANEGSVSIWTKGATNWTHSLELRGPSANVEAFGYSVALDGVDLIVGAPSHNVVGGPAGTGAVHFFTLRNGTWTPSGTFANPIALNYVYFGRSVALRGKTALAGTDYYAVNRAWSFRKGRFNRGWSLDQELGGSDKGTADNYGSAVGIGDETLVVGAPTHGGTYTGKVYLFDSDEINLSITPTQPAPGQTISVSVYDGTPGDPVMLVVDEIDGIPTWIVLTLDVFDATHRYEFDADAENPLLGFNVGLLALKLSPTGPVVFSDRVNVDL